MSDTSATPAESQEVRDVEVADSSSSGQHLLLLQAMPRQVNTSSHASRTGTEFPSAGPHHANFTTINDIFNNHLSLEDKEGKKFNTFRFSSGIALMYFIICWPLLFIAVTFILFYSVHPNSGDTYDGITQIPTLSMTGKLVPGSLVFTYGLHLEALLLLLAFTIIHWQFHHKINAIERQHQRQYRDSQQSVIGMDSRVIAEEPSPATVGAMSQPGGLGHGESNANNDASTYSINNSNGTGNDANDDLERQLEAAVVSNENNFIGDHNNNNNDNNNAGVVTATDMGAGMGMGMSRQQQQQSEGAGTLSLDEPPIRCCEGMNYCCCCLCTQQMAKDTNTRYLRYWNRRLFILGVLACVFMSLVGTFTLDVDEPLHGVVAFFMYCAAILHLLLYHWTIADSVGRSQWQLLLHRFCVFMVIPFNLLGLVLAAVLFVYCGTDICKEAAIDLTPTLEYVTTAVLVVYIYSFKEDVQYIDFVAISPSSSNLIPSENASASPNPADTAPTQEQ